MTGLRGRRIGSMVSGGISGFKTDAGDERQLQKFPLPVLRERVRVRAERGQPSLLLDALPSP